MSLRNFSVAGTRSTCLPLPNRRSRGLRIRSPRRPSQLARDSLRMIRAKPPIITTRMTRPRTAGHTYDVAVWPDAWIAATPRIGRPSVTKMLHTPTALIAAVLATGVTSYEASIAYCTPSPNAPPAGTPLLIAKAAWLSCWECQYDSPGVAARNGSP